jgi:hypothetical protein
LMTYANMKPLDPKAHQHLADWVNKGGNLVYSGTDSDPFQRVQEWWNTKENKYGSPSEHLFELMEIPRTAKEGRYKFGKGSVHIIRTDPKDFALQANTSQKLIDVVKDLYDSGKGKEKLAFKNNFYLQRGMFDLVAVLDESVSDKPVTTKGTLIDLFDPTLPVYQSKLTRPGEQGYFLNVDRVPNKNKPQVLAAASRTYDEKIGTRSYSYVAKSPINTNNVARVLLPSRPKQVQVDGKDVFKPENWDAKSKTYLLSFENNPDGVGVSIAW